MALNLKPDNMVWYIAKHQNGKVYHVTEVEKELNAAHWSIYRKHAIQFTTEAGVHNFIHSFLKDRKDIFLINGPPEGDI